MPVLGVVTVHQHGHATRFGASDEGMQRSRVSGLDRAYSALPPHQLANTRVWVQLGDARVLDRRGDRTALSDHRPLATIWSARRPTPPHLRRIPEWVARSADYAHDVTARHKEAGLECLPLSDALRRTKQIMRTSAAKARNAIVARDPRGKLSRRHLALQVVRALHRSDIRSLERAISEVPDLGEVIRVDLEAREVTIADEAKLNRLLAEAIQSGNNDEAGHQAGPSARHPQNGRRAGRCTTQSRDKVL